MAIDLIIKLMFFSISLLAIIVFLIKLRDDISKSLQLIGTLVILSINLITKNPWVHVLSVFIIATLVTDLEFLTQLAALFFGRKEYWEYVIKKATPQEVKEEIGKEISIPENAISNKKLDSKSPLYEAFLEQHRLQINKAMDLRHRIIDLLGSKDGLFPKHHIIKQDSILQLKDNKRVMIDVLAEGPKRYIYLIEIKLTKSIDSIFKAISELMQAELSYNVHFRKIKSIGSARSFIIATCEERVAKNSPIPILIYDPERNRFTNLDSLRRWIYE